VVTEPRVALSELLSAGRGALTRYTGTLLAVFVVQLTVAGAATFAMARVFAAAFSTFPYFDQAVDGDLTVWVYLLRNHREVMAAAGWIGGGAVLMWLLVSWFLAAGMIGVFAERPEGRAETARCFGARGAASFLPLVRLWALTAPTYFIVALSMGRLAMWLTVALLPGLLLLHLLWTISEYARAELVLRRDSHGLSVVAAYARAIALVLRRPMTLVHSGLGWLLVGVISIGYWAASHGHPMAGSDGAVTLLIVRQGVVLARMAVHFAVLAGQVALTRQRALPIAAAPEARRRGGAD
jgi:hypothetical protein